MKDFASLVRGGTRRLGLAAALAGAALFLAAGESMPSAEAGTARADLTPGAAAAGTGAQGRIQFKQQRRGERLKLRLDNLQPRTDYEIRDAATEDVLGTVRTDRRGRAKKTLRGAPGRSLSGALLEICEPGSEDPILEGRVPGDDSEMPWFQGTYRVGTVSTDPEAAVQVSITLSSTTGTTMAGIPSDGAIDRGEPGEEGTYDSISLFAGSGGVWIMEDGSNGGFPDLASIPGPVTFWIADRGNGLVKVATIEKDDWGMPMPLLGEGRAADRGADRRAESRADRRARRAERRAARRAARRSQALSCGLPDFNGDGGTTDGGDGTIFPQPDTYSWYADNQAEPFLPLGVPSVSDLSGRAFEVRDGEGAVLLEGVLPELEEIVYEPQPDPMPWPDFPCPGGDFNIDIDINIDFSGIDWGSFDWGSIDGGSFPAWDGSCFDFSKFIEEFGT